MKVVKFGGSSLASGNSVDKALSIINADPERQVVVVSAPGKRTEDDIKVTDLMITYAYMSLRSNNYQDIATRIFKRYELIAQYFELPEAELEDIKQLLLTLPKLSYPNNDYRMATFKAHGERLNAILIAKILNHQGIKARFLEPKDVGLIVTGTSNNAEVNPETYVNLKRIKAAKDEKIIFPGFYGITPSGHIATFSRGGSDITGAILARGLNADLYENFTDVDAIFSANPHIVDQPKPIKRMTYQEMRELSYAGFSVFHDEALIPAIQGEIPVNVKNTNAPEKPGTMIVPEDGFIPKHTITGIAGGKNFAALYLRKYMLNKGAGFTLKLMEILQKHHVSYEHMPSGIDDITIIFKKDVLTDQLIDVICNEIQTSLNPDQMQWIDDYAITMVVGEGMKDKLTLCARLLYPLGKKNISIQMINQGASQISIMIGTRRQDEEVVIKTIYDNFIAQDKI